MKKLSLVIAVLCFVLASCGEKKQASTTETSTTATATEECKKHDHDKGKCCGMTEEQKKECEEFQKKWDNWANLTDVEKKELVDKKKACFDKKQAKMEEMEAKMKAEKAEINAQMANWNTLTLEEQKTLLDKIGKCCKPGKCCGNKDTCKK